MAPAWFLEIRHVNGEIKVPEPALARLPAPRIGLKSTFSPANTVFDCEVAVGGVGGVTEGTYVENAFLPSESVITYVRAGAAPEKPISGVNLMVVPVTS
jgi:hypothetical protein